MRRGIESALALLMVLGSSSCASDDARAPGTEISGPDGASLTGKVGGTDYPKGPYGRNNPEVGDIIEDFKLRGYWGFGEPIDVAPRLEEIQLSDLRDDEARFLLIHISSFWCATCQAEAFYMSEYTDELVDAGGAVLEILVDGEAVGVDPSKEQLDVWVASLDLKGTTMIPGDDVVRRVFPDRDYVYIVDLETMEVVWRERGPSLDPTTTEIGAVEMLENFLPASL